MQKTIILIALSIICFVYPRDINSETIKSNEEIKQIITDALKEIESSENKQEIIYQINIIRKIAPEDTEGNEVKRAVLILVKLVKNEDHNIKIEAAKALWAISDKSAIPALEELKKQGNIGNPEGNYYPFAHYAKGSIKAINDRNKFRDLIKELNTEEKVPYLIDAFKSNKSIGKFEGKYGDIGLNWAISYLVKIGKPAVPMLVKSLEEAIEYKKQKDKIKEVPYKPETLIEGITIVLGEVGDERALTVLKKLESYYLKDKGDSFAPSYLRETINKLES